jgi:hypothetical protein
MVYSIFPLHRYPEVALHFVDDHKTKFDLAIECGNIEIAMASAYEIDEDECWHKVCKLLVLPLDHNISYPFHKPCFQLFVIFSTWFSFISLVGCGCTSTR